MNKEKTTRESKIKEDKGKSKSKEELINVSKNSGTEKEHVEVKKEDNKQDGRNIKESTVVLPPLVQIKQYTGKFKENYLQEHRKENAVTENKMKQEKNKDFVKVEEKKEEKKKETKKQTYTQTQTQTQTRTQNKNKLIIHNSMTDDSHKNISYKDKPLGGLSVSNKNTKSLEKCKIQNSQNKFGKVPSMPDLNFSSKVDENYANNERNNEIYHSRKGVAFANGKNPVEPKRRLEQQVSDNLLSGKFYFVRNKSSICSNTNKLKKLLEKQYDRPLTSLNENKKKKKRKKIKKVHDEKEGVESDLYTKQIISENIKDSGTSIKTEEENRSHIVVNLCSNDSSSSSINSSSSVDSDKKEGLEKKLNNPFHDQQLGDDDYTFTKKYRSCYVLSDSLLNELRTKTLLDKSERASGEKLSVIEFEKDNNISSSNVSRTKKTQSRLRNFTIGNSNILKGKKKEKIIIFLNRKYCVWETENFNDHFYNTLYKPNGTDGPEGVEIYIDDFTKNRIKRIIYKIFPQFSFYSFILYISFFQWLIYLFLLFVQTDSSLSPSHDTLNSVTNYPMRIFKFSEYHRPFTSLLLHSNFNHICSNTYIQLTVGFLLEYLYGTPLVFFVYMFTGIHGMVLSFPLTYCESTTESSTSTFGLIGMFFSEILIMTNFNVDKIGVSVNLICFYLLLLFLKLTTNAALINVWSHFMGLIGGFLFGIILKYKKLKYFVKHDFFIFAFCIIFFITSTVLAIMLTVFHPKCVM